MPLYVKSPISKKYFPDDLCGKYGSRTLFPKNFLPFEEAREFIKKLKLKGQREWNKYCKSGKKPDNIPSNPYATYKDKGWISWGDFLGTGIVRGTNFLPFEEARTFARKLKLKSWAEWKSYCQTGKKPNNIPFMPNFYYKNKGWKDIGDFLGTGKVRGTNFLSFKEAKTFVRKLKFKNCKEWDKYRKSNKRATNIPSAPNMVYKDKGWKGTDDFLGTGNIQNVRGSEFLSFKEAKIFVRKLKLKDIKEWNRYCKSGKKPKNIPSSVKDVYKGNGWISWVDFLGTEFIPFEEARVFARKLKLKNWEEWNKYCKSGKKPDNIPVAPNSAYKDKGWCGFVNFLGTEFLSFKEARTFVRKLKLKNWEEWNKYCKSGKKPDNIPSSPYTIYKDNGWNGVRDFLGTK